MQQDYVSTISRNAGVPFMEYICGQHDDLEYGQSLYTAWEFAGIHGTGLPMRQSWCSDGQYPCPDCLWPSPALCPGCWPRARTQARPHSAQRTRQPSNTVTVSTAGRLQPDIGAGYHHSRQDTLSYTCPQVTLTLSPCLRSSRLLIANGHIEYALILTVTRPCPLPPQYAHHAHSAASCGYAVISAVSGAQHTQPGVAKWLSHPPLEYTHHALPPLCQLWLLHLSQENAHHARTSTSCGYMASHQSLEYAHHAQPGVAMWLSHPSLEYAHHAHLSASARCGYVAISFIPGVRTPRPARCGYVAISPIPGVHPPRPPLCLCQLWLRGYLAYPWSTPTTPTSLPAVATWLSHPSLEYAHHAHLSASASCVATWLSHPSPKYAHHAHLSASASCGYLTYPRIMPTTPTLLPAVATWLLINPWSTHTTPSQVCLSHLSLEYAHHAHPLPAVATWLSHLSLEHTHHARSSTSCGYAAIPPIHGVRPTHLAICQVWLCGYLPYPLSTPTTPTLCQRRLCSYLIYPWSTPILLPAAATRLFTWPWNTPTTPSQPQVWWLCGHLTFHQVGFSG